VEGGGARENVVVEGVTRDSSRMSNKIVESAANSHSQSVRQAVNQSVRTEDAMAQGGNGQSRAEGGRGQLFNSCTRLERLLA
jgi:hypothetical protein